MDTQPQDGAETFVRKQLKEALRQADEAVKDALQAARALHAQREQNRALRSWVSQAKTVLFRHMREQRGIADVLSLLADQGEKLLTDEQAPTTGEDVDTLKRQVTQLEADLETVIRQAGRAIEARNQAREAQHLAQRQHADLVAAVALWGARLADAQGADDWRKMLSPEVRSALEGTPTECREAEVKALDKAAEYMRASIAGPGLFGLEEELKRALAATGRQVPPCLPLALTEEESV